MPAVRRLARVCLAVVVSLCAALAGGRVSVRAQTPKRLEMPANFDIRIGASLKQDLLQRLSRSPQAETTPRLQRAVGALAGLEAEVPGITVAFSPYTGGAEMVRTPRGALTGISRASTIAIATGFLRSHAALFGLTTADVDTVQFRGESLSRRNGLRMLRAEQVIAGIPVFQSDARFIVDRDGRLIRTLTAFVPAASAADVPAATISSAEALVSALDSVAVVERSLYWDANGIQFSGGTNATAIPVP